MDDLSPSRQVITVLVVDDHAGVREGLRAYLSSRPELRIVGIAVDGKEAVGLAMSTKPEVVLMDLRMPLGEGVSVTERIVALPQGSKVVWFSFEDDEDTVLRIRQAGASGFVSKQGAAAEVVDAIREVVAGRSYFRREIARIPVRETRVGSLRRASRKAVKRESVELSKR